MKRKTLVVASVLLAVLVAYGVAFAWPYYCQSRPVFAGGENFGYFIWHGDGWHLRASTVDQNHAFTGSIMSNGPIFVTQIKTINLAEGDFVKQVGPNSLSFQITATGNEVGFDFRTEGNMLTYSLFRDGNSVETKHIHLGGGAVSPRNNPFTIYDY